MYPYGHLEQAVSDAEVVSEIPYKKKQWRPPGKQKKRGKNTSPRNRKACQCQHCPLAKRHGDRNPEYHEDQQKDAA
jgi:hypothetical protein